MRCCLLVAFWMILGALRSVFNFFFFNDTATTEIYTLSLHDALPTSHPPDKLQVLQSAAEWHATFGYPGPSGPARSEEHTSELQSRLQLVCRLLLEKKKLSRVCSVPARRKTHSQLCY